MRKVVRRGKTGHKGEMAAKLVRHNITLQVVILREDDRFIAYSPALELSTFGKSVSEAQKAFSEALDLFVEEVGSAGTLEKVLLGLGWTLEPRKYNPPIRGVKANPTEIIRTYPEKFSVPAYA